MAATTPQADKMDTGVPEWGRLLLVGGTNWPHLGRKADKAMQDDHPDLMIPCLLRAMRTIKVTEVFSSSVSCHTVAIDIYGAAYLFGRAASGALGIPGVSAVWETGPFKVTPVELGAVPGTKFVHAATGRAHTLLVGSDGNVWSAGVNNSGQCGHSVCPEISTFTRIEGAWLQGGDGVVQASAGSAFSLVLTESGRVYAFGSAEKGQLGNGRTGEHIVTSGRAVFDLESTPILVKGLQDRKIVQIASGPQHSIVVDSNGYVLVWGCAGYCRLGLGDQKDTLFPKVVPTFADDREASRGASVYAGPTCSAVIDRSGLYWLAGKWKISGDGSSGQPWSSFRFFQDIMGIKAKTAALGGVTLWVIAPDPDREERMLNIAWGQNAVNGELGFGEDKPKSATKPQQSEIFADMHMISIAAGAHATFFVAKPGDAVSELPAHPDLAEPAEHCALCKTDKGEENSPLECEMCESLFHLDCLSPPLSEIPEGEWFCSQCEALAQPNATFPPPNVLKDTNHKNDGTPKRGRGRPRKYTEQSMVMYAPDDSATGSVGVGEKRKEMDDYEDMDDDGTANKRRRGDEY